MPKKTHGGPGRGQGRKSNREKGLPKLTWRSYERIPIPNPVNDREADAIEWFKSLEPFERMNLIVGIYGGGNAG